VPDVLRPAALAALLLLSAPAQGEETVPEGRVLGNETLETLVSGRTQYGNRSDGSSDIEFHSSDGRSAYWYEGCLYRGIWWATDDSLCYIYPTTTWPGPHCFFVERQDGALRFVGTPGDPDALVITITDNVPGNPENFPLDGEGNCDLVSELEGRVAGVRAN
jgi:hypothetical protein